MNGGCRRAPGAGSPALASCSLQKMHSCVLSCCLALQHLAVQASLLCIFHLLLLPTLPEEQAQAQATDELLARSLFACGISTVLQTCLGSRLPLVQIPSFEYLVPAMVLSSHLSLSDSTDRNGTAVASACPALRCDVVGSRTSSLREVSGAIVFSGLVQLVLGVSGACGWTARRCGPMVLAPSLSIVGLSAYKEAAFFCSANWGVALLLVLLTVTFSQHLGSCRLPCCVWPFAQGGSAETSVPTLRTFSVLLPFTSVCIICAVLSHLRVPWDSLELATEQLPWANSTVRSPWLRIPYPGGDGQSCVVLGMSPRLAGLLTRIPLVVHGGVLCVTYAVAVGTGISYFRYADIDSGRNIFIVGFTMFMALLVPRWLSTAPVHLATGWVPLDLLFLSLLMVPVFLTGFLSFFLENTVSGTLEERGLLTNLAARRGDRCPRGERDDISRIYRLPAGLRRLLPPSRCKAFPCCFLCPGREWEEEEEGSRAAEEGTAGTGEGMHLLLKASTVEMQSERRPSETETPVWHVAA
nr:PREDICTED: solute carrier family 23 member 3 [Struthio camelus australis]